MHSLIVKGTKFLGDVVVQDDFGAKPCLRIQAVLGCNASMDYHPIFWISVNKILSNMMFKHSDFEEGKPRYF